LWRGEKIGRRAWREGARSTILSRRDVTKVLIAISQAGLTGAAAAAAEDAEDGVRDGDGDMTSVPTAIHPPSATYAH